MIAYHILLFALLGMVSMSVSKRNERCWLKVSKGIRKLIFMDFLIWFSLENFLQLYVTLLMDIKTFDNHNNGKSLYLASLIGSSLFSFIYSFIFILIIIFILKFKSITPTSKLYVLKHGLNQWSWIMSSLYYFHYFK